MHRWAGGKEEQFRKSVLWIRYKSSSLEMLQTEVKVVIKIFPPHNVDDIISTVLVASGSLLPCFLYSILVSSTVAGKWNSEVLD